VKQTVTVRQPAERSGITGIVLAAGMAARFGSPKQLLEIAGRTLVRRIADEACASRLDDVIVVVGWQADAVRAALDGSAARVVENPHYAAGQSTSVRAGLAAVADAAAGAMFLVADQPWLTAVTIDLLIDAYARTGGPVVVPVFGNRRGSPVIFSRAIFPELMALEGDTGGRPVIAAHAADVVEVPLADERPLIDVDTPHDLDTYNSKLRT
jgi:molybdenum cofactor cytidylyltransferase